MEGGGGTVEKGEFSRQKLSSHDTIGMFAYTTPLTRRNNAPITTLNQCLSTTGKETTFRRVPLNYLSGAFYMG